MGRWWGNKWPVIPWQKPEGLSALGCLENSEWEVRMPLFPHGGCANILSLRLPRPGNLTHWFREFRQQSPRSFFFWLHLRGDSDGSKWLHGGVCHSVQLLSQLSAEKLLADVLLGKETRCHLGLCQPEDQLDPTDSLEGRHLDLQLEPDLRFSASAA